MEFRVRTEQGLLEGFKEESVYKFYGIPFAEPPIGNRRWRSPEPPSSWNGVRESKKFGPACIQTAGAVSDMRVDEQSEDCLYLNVWTDSLDSPAKKPVMVWIHGGGFLGGAGSEDAYDGSCLARKGVTMVTFNYRLGAFGFISHPNVGANFGIQDCVAALKWVKNNISEFGGDPNNVTIFGQSAGAVGVRSLLSCPSALGLFHRAIIQSGGGENPAFVRKESYSRTQVATEELFHRLGSLDIETLRQVPSAVLKIASHELSGVFPTPGKVHTPANLVWMPVVDGITLMEGDYPGWSNQVPVMLGCTENEARYFIKPGIPYTREVLENMIKGLCGTKNEEVMALFDETHVMPYEAMDKLITTTIFTEPAMETAHIFSELGRKVYCYHFNRVSPGAKITKELAKHTAEIPYIFGNFTDDGTYDEVDHQVSEQIQDAWITFARNGVPESQTGELWPLYNSDTPSVAWIQDSITSRPFPVTKLMTVINSIRTSDISLIE